MRFLFWWLLAFVLLAASYNPTRWHYIGWAATRWEDQGLPVASAGLALAVAYAVMLHLTLRAIGLYGMFLVLAVVATAVWVLSDRGIVDPGDPGLVTWIALGALSLGIGVGLWWGATRRRLEAEEAAHWQMQAEALHDDEALNANDDARRNGTGRE